MWPFIHFHVYIPFFFNLLPYISILSHVFWLPLKNLYFFENLSEGFWSFLRLLLQETLHVWPSFPRATFISCYDPLMVQRLCYHPVVLLLLSVGDPVMMLLSLACYVMSQSNTFPFFECVFVSCIYEGFLNNCVIFLLGCDGRMSLWLFCWLAYADWTSLFHQDNIWWCMFIMYCRPMDHFASSFFSFSSHVLWLSLP